MRKVLAAAIAVVALGGCVSTTMKQSVGLPIEEAYMRHGRPVNEFDLPDGRRAFQFRVGGGTATLPQYGTATATTVGATTTVSTMTTPGMVHSEGCLTTLIAAKRGTGWVVEESRVPKQLVC